MNDIEYRLRDAYFGATQTVTPDTIRELDQFSATISWPATPTPTVRPRPRRWMIPLSAAAAVVAIAATIAIVLPQVLAGLRADSNHGPAVTGSPARHFLAATSADGATISIHNATTGATVATIEPPVPGLNFNSLATGNGVSYVAAAWREGVCGTSLYGFRLTSSGRPTALAKFGPGSVNELISQLAVSKDGSTLAFWGSKCAQVRSDVADDLGVMNVATRHIRLWSIPGQVNVNPLYLSADGRLLEYSVPASKYSPSAIYLLSTSAAPGAAANRSRVLARAAQFGVSAQINSAVMTPQASTVYFTTNTAGTFTRPWQLRAVSVATGRSRLIGGGPAGLPDPLAANPSATQAILIIESPAASYVSADPSTSPTAGPFPSTSPTAGPFPSTTSTTRVTSVELRLPEQHALVLRVDLATGKFTVLKQALWQPQTFTYFW